MLIHSLDNEMLQCVSISWHSTDANPESKQEIAAAKHFIAEEIAEKRSEVKVRFNADAERLLDTFPGLEFDDILACILVAPNTAKMDSVIKAYSSIGVNDSRGSLVERISPPDLMKLEASENSDLVVVFLTNTNSLTY